MRRIALTLFLAVTVAAAAFVWLRTLSQGPGTLAAPAASTTAESVSYPCYFPSRSGFDLIEEIRQRPKPASASDRLRAVIEELHRGPATAEGLPLFPAGTAPRAIFLASDGALYLDEQAAAFEKSPGLREEFLFVRAFARTLLRNCPEVNSFVFLSDGKARHRLFTHLPAPGRYLLPRQPIPRGR